MTHIRFWNGNKSEIRQRYELALLKTVLSASGQGFDDASILEDLTDYPSAEDEGSIFERQTDLCVTVAGNPKFTEGDYISVNEPLMNGLLGHRLLVIRQSESNLFSAIKTSQQLQSKTAGIPATWADAPLFRANDYPVSERGTLDTVFQHLKNKECDYVALGVNEIDSLFDQFASNVGGLMIEPTLRLYYPYALVFYVNPNNPVLADSIQRGLIAIKQSGAFQQLFSQFFSTLLVNADLKQRSEILLDNPALPANLLPKLAPAKTNLLAMPQG